MKGQIFRIAHLGYFDFADLFAMVAELEIILHANGYPVEFGTGVAAVQNVYSEVAVAPQSRARMTILVAEPLAEAAVALLKSQPGWNVIVSSPKEYANHLAEADALIVRSAVQVNPVGARQGAPPARDRPRGRGRRQRRSGSRHRGRRPGDEHARRQRHLGGGAHPGADAGHGAPHSRSYPIHHRRQVGKEEVHGQRTARQIAGHRRAWAASAAKW